MKKEKSDMLSSIIDALDSLRLEDFVFFTVRIMPFIVLRGLFICMVWTISGFLLTKLPIISVAAISLLLGVCYSTLENHLR